MVKKKTDVSQQGFLVKRMMKLMIFCKFFREAKMKMYGDRVKIDMLY